MNFFQEEIPFMATIRVSDLIDIAILAFLIYHIFWFMRKTSSGRVLKGIMVLILTMWLASAIQLTATSWLLNRVVEWGILVLVILFQPEIRRVLEQMGSRRFIAFFTHAETGNTMDTTIGQTVLACSEMSQSRTGALIVFEREILLDDMVRSGTVLDASVSSELLKNIFFVKAPMHDGAVIIRNGRVLGAGCMLPLSKNVNLSRDLGMRHRAGIGMSENSDAVVVIVSEETGSISVAIGGMLKRHLKPETLENLLRNELLPQEEPDSDKQKFFSLLSLLQPKKNGGKDDAE